MFSYSVFIFLALRKESDTLFLLKSCSIAGSSERIDKASHVALSNPSF